MRGKKERSRWVRDHEMILASSELDKCGRPGGGTGINACVAEDGGDAFCHNFFQLQERLSLQNSPGFTSTPNYVMVRGIERPRYIMQTYRLVAYFPGLFQLAKTLAL